MPEDALSYTVLFEESPNLHGCTRSSCTDPMGMSRIALERLIARWPVSERTPDFADGELITVVGVLTRSGYDLVDPEHSQRVLLAYAGTWSASLGVLWLPGSEARGYITFEATRGFAPLSWYGGHGHTEDLQAAALQILDGLPTLTPVCFDQIDALPSYEEGDGSILLVVASTHSSNGVRKPARLHFISGASNEDELRGVVRSGDLDEGGHAEWIRDFLDYSEGAASIELTRSITTDEAVRIASLPVDDMWDALAVLSLPAPESARIPQLEPTQTLAGWKTLVAPPGWYFDVTALGFHYEKYPDKEPSLTLTNDGIDAVELRPTWGTVYVIDNYTRNGTISFEADLGVIGLHEDRVGQEARLATTYALHPEIIEFALAMQDQARPPVSTYEDALAELSVWRPSSRNLEFFAAYIELHPETHPEDWDICRDARSVYSGEFDTWSEFAMDYYGDEGEADRDEDELHYLYEECHGHFFKKRDI